MCHMYGCVFFFLLHIISTFQHRPDSDVELSEDEVEEGQREEEDESSEEDAAAVKEAEPEPGKSDDIHCVLWIKSNVYARVLKFIAIEKRNESSYGSHC